MNMDDKLLLPFDRLGCVRGHAPVWHRMVCYSSIAAFDRLPSSDNVCELAGGERDRGSRKPDPEGDRPSQARIIRTAKA